MSESRSSGSAAMCENIKCGGNSKKTLTQNQSEHKKLSTPFAF